MSSVKINYITQYRTCTVEKNLSGLIEVSHFKNVIDIQNIYPFYYQCTLVYITISREWDVVIRPKAEAIKIQSFQQLLSEHWKIGFLLTKGFGTCTHSFLICHRSLIVYGCWLMSKSWTSMTSTARRGNCGWPHRHRLFTRVAQKTLNK